MAGKAAVQNAAHVGRVLGLLDNGMSRSDVADYVIDAALGTPHTHQSFVALLYGNVAGTAPGAAELAYYTQLLDSGQASQSSLALLAVEHPWNTTSADLVGLANLECTTTALAVERHRRAHDGNRQRALGTSCEFTRAIGDRHPRAIGDPILVLSGTGIELKSLFLRAFQPL